MEKKKLGGLVLKVGKQLRGNSKPKRRRRSSQIRKVKGKQAADLQTPAAVATPGSGEILRSGGPTPNVGGIRESAVISKQMNQKGKTLTKKINELKKLEQETATLTGAARGKHMAQTAEKKKLLKESIRDMKRRGITPKRGGGKVVYRSIGGKVINGNDITGMIYD
jgi:hypothetical protein